jgi:hypothetical protein
MAFVLNYISRLTALHVNVGSPWFLRRCALASETFGRFCLICCSVNVDDKRMNNFYGCQAPSYFSRAWCQVEYIGYHFTKKTTEICQKYSQCREVIVAIVTRYVCTKVISILERSERSVFADCVEEHTSNIDYRTCSHVSNNPLLEHVRCLHWLCNVVCFILFCSLAYSGQEINNIRAVTAENDKLLQRMWVLCSVNSVYFSYTDIRCDYCIQWSNLLYRST